MVAYRTVAGDPAPDALAAAGRADAIAFTSSSTVERTVELLAPRADPAGGGLHRPGHLGSARAAGLAVAAEADPHTIDGLVEALVAACGARARPSGELGHRRRRTGSAGTGLP